MAVNWNLVGSKSNRERNKEGWCPAQLNRGKIYSWFLAERLNADGERLVLIFLGGSCDANRGEKNEIQPRSLFPPDRISLLPFSTPTENVFVEGGGGGAFRNTFITVHLRLHDVTSDVRTGQHIMSVLRIRFEKTQHKIIN